MATYKALLEQKAKLEQQLAETRAKEVGEVIAQIQALMAEYELTADDIAPAKRRGPKKGTTSGPAAPKYQDPKTGATWSGRGRAPAWLGKNRDKFLIAQ